MEKGRTAKTATKTEVVKKMVEKEVQVTQEMLDMNPDLVEKGIQIGDKVTIEVEVEETIEAKTNPFDEGVTYEQVVKELGSKSVSTYYKDMLTNEQIEWLTADLEVYKNNQKAK